MTTQHLPVPFAPDVHPTLAGMLTHYLFENPWPLAVLCVIAGVVLGRRALAEGERASGRAALAAFAGSALALALGFLITTNGERASAVVRELMARAEAGNTAGMLELLTPGCVLHYGAPENPGVPREMWEPAIGLLKGRYTIERNTITRLEAESAGRASATVELACVTSVSLAPYPTPNAWWLKVAEQSDGSWRIERIAARRIGSETPTPGTF